MGIFENASSLLYGFWLPLLLLAFTAGGFLLAREQIRERFEVMRSEREATREENRLRLEFDRAERERYYGTSRRDETTGEVGDMLRAYLDSSLSQVASRLSSAITENAQSQLRVMERRLEEIAASAAVRAAAPGDLSALEQTLRDAVRSELSEKPAQGGRLGSRTEGGPSATPRTTPEALIREVSHALNTPLSRIEVIAETRLPDAAMLQDSVPELAGGLQQIRSSVDICKAYLAAFRQMVLISNQSLLWTPSSLSSVTEAAFQVFCKSGEGKAIKVSLPDRIPGQDNNLVFAIILPLLENAIEACPPGGVVDVSSRRADTIYVITITNEALNPPATERMFERGYTTKVDHEGIGLSIVQSLVTTIPGGQLAAEVINDRVVKFTISMPSEISDAP